MKSLLVVILLFVGVTRACLPDFVEFNGECYHVHVGKLNWNQAHEYCAQRESKLASFEKLYELKKFGEVILLDMDIRDFWVSAAFVNAKWKWITVGKISPDLWCWKEPNAKDSAKEPAGKVVFDGGNWCLKTDPIGRNHGVICEAPCSHC